MPIPTKSEIEAVKDDRGTLIAAIPLDGSPPEIEFEAFITAAGWEEYFAQMERHARKDTDENPDYAWFLVNIERCGDLLEEEPFKAQDIAVVVSSTRPMSEDHVQVEQAARKAALHGEERNAWWVQPEPKKAAAKQTTPKVKVKKKSSAVKALSATEAPSPKGNGGAQAALKARLKAKAEAMAGSDGADLVDEKVIVASV